MMRFFIAVSLLALASCSSDSPKSCTTSEDCGPAAVCEQKACAALPQGECRLPSVCTAPSNATATCSDTHLCGFNCNQGFVDCSGECVQESPDACGPACTKCTAPQNGYATCTVGVCGSACYSTAPDLCPDQGSGLACLNQSPCPISCTADQTLCAAGCCSTPTAVSAGGDFTCILTKAKQVQCFGDNAYGKLGNNSVKQSLIGVDVLSSPGSVLNGITSISAGGSFACAVTGSSGGVKCWGQNDLGQLGNNTETPSSVAVDVLDASLQQLTGSVLVSSGTNSACELGASGGVSCWGSNANGELGIATTQGSPVALAVTLASASAISVASHHACAALKSGSASCWGLNTNSSLGLGDSTVVEATTPTPVVNLSTVQTISASTDNTCALTTGGGVYCWGFGSAGQLGNGSTSFQSSVPVQVTNLSSGVIQVGAGYHFACALTAGGSVLCWGANDAGQLGNGTTSNSSVPVQTTGLNSGVTSLSVGSRHACALMNSGTVKCWGSNAFGNLGDGTTTSRTTPVAVLLDH